MAIHIVVIPAVATKPDDIEVAFLHEPLEVPEAELLLWTIEKSDIEAVFFENRAEIENAQIRSNPETSLANRQCEQNPEIAFPAAAKCPPALPIIVSFCDMPPLSPSMQIRQNSGVRPGQAVIPVSVCIRPLRNESGGPGAPLHPLPADRSTSRRTSFQSAS